MHHFYLDFSISMVSLLIFIFFAGAKIYAVPLPISRTFDELKKIVKNMGLGQTLEKNNFGESTTNGIILEFCSGLKKADFVVCCNSPKYLENVMYKEGKFLIYIEDTKISNETLFLTLPTLFQHHYRYSKTTFTVNMPIEFVPQRFDKSNCKEYFDGTLHIAGRKTIYKLFHVMNDNMLPLISQMVMDTFLFPEYTHLPHMSLTLNISKNLIPDLSFEELLTKYGNFSLPTSSLYKSHKIIKNDLIISKHKTSRNSSTRRLSSLLSFQNFTNMMNSIYKGKRRKNVTDLYDRYTRFYLNKTSRVRTRHSTAIERLRVEEITKFLTSFPHMNLYKHLLTGGEITQEKADGMCFRRVVWGTGIRLHYVDSAVVLRRLTTDFLRSLALNAYNHPLPKAYTPHISRRHLKGPLNINGRPLRILYMSRGSNGKGRSLMNEYIIAQKLSNAGAVVHMCCSLNETYSLDEQMPLALYADVVMGPHGAGLVNAVFSPRGVIVVELKSIYGFKTDVFLRTTDAREGVHVHIDIRKYCHSKKERILNVVDDDLAERVVNATIQALEIQKRKEYGRIFNISTTGEDYIITPSGTDGALGTILGPTLHDLGQTCLDKLVFAEYRRRILHGNVMEHCQTCPQNLTMFYR